MIRLRLYLGSSPHEGPSDTIPAGVERIDHVAEVLTHMLVSGATLIPAVGMWEGALESSLVIELLGDYTADSVRAIAGELAERFDQDAVFWTLDTVGQSGAEGSATDE